MSITNLTFNTFAPVLLLFTIAFPQEKSTVALGTFQSHRTEDHLKLKNDTLKPNFTTDPCKDSLKKAVLREIKLESKLITGTTDEYIVKCRFVFKNQPCSYFYETKLTTKNIVFEFFNATLDTFPIASLRDLNIKGIGIQSLIDEVEKTDLLRVTFYMGDIPLINVADSNGIEFTFKWTTNPRKIKKFGPPHEDGFWFAFWKMVPGIVVWTAIFIVGAYFIIKH